MLTYKQRATRSTGSKASSYKSAAIMAQRAALRMAARDTRLIGYPRMSQRYGGMKTGSELKGMDTTISFNPILATTGTNGNTSTLNLIQTGTGSWNRIGRKVNLKSLRVKGIATCLHFQDAGNDIQGNTLRMCVVWDKQPAGGTEPLFSDIFGVTSQAGAETSTFFSPPKYDTMDRFRVLKDWEINSTAQATPGAGDYVRNTFAIDCYISLGDLESTYSGQSAPMTIADINNGALYLIARAQTQNAATTEFSLEAVCRLRYVD